MFYCLQGDIGPSGLPGKDGEQVPLYQSILGNFHFVHPWGGEKWGDHMEIFPSKGGS